MAAHDDKEEEKLGRRARQWDDAREQLVDGALGSLLQYKDGRALVWWLLGVCEIGGLAFQDDERRTILSLGAQNVGQQLLARMERVDPFAYPNMMKENIEDERDRAAALSPAHGGNPGPDSE